MALKPASTFTAIRTPIANPQTGEVSWEWVKKFQEWELKLQNGLDTIGRFTGEIDASATISTRSGTVGTALQHIDPVGVLAATALNGVIAHANIPAAGLGVVGGVQAVDPTSHQWVDAIDETGLPSLSQPDFTDISGVAAPQQLPAPTTSTLGGVQAVTPVAHEWINSIDTSGVPQLSRPDYADLTGTPTGLSVTITTAALTGLGSQGSMTFTNGILTAQTPAT
jgi:hypothetical protein